MAISKRIIKEIKQLDTDNNIKKLIISILEEQDSGLFRYKDKYEELIDQYLSNKKKGDQKYD